MVGVIRKIKIVRNCFGRICVVFFFVSYVFAKAVRQSSPCFAYVDLTQRVGYAIDDIYGDACKVPGEFCDLSSEPKTLLTVFVLYFVFVLYLYCICICIDGSAVSEHDGLVFVSSAYSR